MSINFNKYVDITSGVGASSVVSNRQLIGRFFTVNPLLPPQTFLEFSSAAAVGAYFGTTSEEYLRSLFYFGWISKNITTPQKISFARWANAATAPEIFGNVQSQVLANYNVITTGSFGLTINGTVNMFSSLDFSAVGSLAAVAAILQTAIRTASGSMWTSATVTYDSTRGCFDFVGGVTGAATISVQAGSTGVDITPSIGWLPEATYINGVYLSGAIVAPGSAVETITEVLQSSSDQSNNFGSFAFVPALSELSEVQEAATWNDEQNVVFMFSVPVTSANAISWAAVGSGVGGIGGCGLTLQNISGQYAEQILMMIEAATNYSAVNSTQNYEFQQFPGLLPEVTDTATSDAMDALSINYYGQTQTAGQQISFYQRGVLQGGATDPLDMNVYANEQWLKDAAGAAIMTLLLSLAKVSANVQGRSQILTILQSVINQALNNGTISVGKPFNTIQILYITQLTGDPNAWYQVQNSGYWVNCTIVASGSPVTYKATYTLVYSKDDVIRMVDGTHVLI